MDLKNSKAPMPSFVWLPDESSCATVLDFLCLKFPRIERKIWIKRIQEGKVSYEDNSTISLQTPYTRSRRLKYFREVENEVAVPFQEKILFENEEIIIVDKPHFLPIHPAGKFVNETLISRLKVKYDLPELAICHRLDRLTAGIVLATKQKKFRGLYQNLFMNRKIHKTYLAIGSKPHNNETEWHVRNHLAPYLKHFRMTVKESEEVNSESHIKLLESKNQIALFQLTPATGKKHQLRVHMTCIGSRILNDPLYPEFEEIPQKDDYSKPLQLLAKQLRFVDPVSKQEVCFISQQNLNLPQA